MELFEEDSLAELFGIGTVAHSSLLLMLALGTSRR